MSRKSLVQTKNLNQYRNFLYSSILHVLIWDWVPTPIKVVLRLVLQTHFWNEIPGKAAISVLIFFGFPIGYGPSVESVGVPSRFQPTDRRTVCWTSPNVRPTNGRPNLGSSHNKQQNWVYNSNNKPDVTGYSSVFRRTGTGHDLETLSSWSPGWCQSRHNKLRREVELQIYNRLWKTCRRFFVSRSVVKK